MLKKMNIRFWTFMLRTYERAYDVVFYPRRVK
jgi:hypothetical protein